MHKSFLGLCLLVSLTALPAVAQQPAPKERFTSKQSAPVQEKKSEDADVDFVDSDEAYWVTKGVNDTLYGANGSFNQVRLERDSARNNVEKLNNIYKPPQVEWAKKKPNPALKINGKVVETKP